MKSVNEDELNKEESFFHFSPASAYSSVDKNGLNAVIGPHAQGVEHTKKVFFSKGELGLLQMQEVWLKWEMNRMFRAEMSWNREFLQRKYLGDDLKKNAVFKKFYNDMKERVYYQLDLKDGEDFSYDDIDETKIDALKNKKERKEIKEKTGIDIKPYHYLYLSEFYFPFGNVDDRKMEKFNMHTFKGKGVEPEKISLVKIVEKDGEREIEKNDALSVGIHIYDKNKDKISEFDLLHDFITFAKNRLKDEKEQGISSEGKVVDEIKKEQNILNRMNDKIGYFYNQKDIDREER